MLVGRVGIDRTSGTRVTKNLWRQSPTDQTKMEMRREISVFGEYTNTLGIKSHQRLFWEAEASNEGHGSGLAW